MNYNLLSNMGLGNVDLTYLFIGAFVAIFFAVDYCDCALYKSGKTVKEI